MWAEFRTKYGGVRRAVVEDYVKSCKSCELHRPLKDRDIIRNITASKNWERIQIDLIDVKKYAEHNAGFTWILHAVDVYSRFSFVYPMKSKTAIEVILFHLICIGNAFHAKTFHVGGCSFHCAE